MAASDEGDAPTYPVKLDFVRFGDRSSFVGDIASIFCPSMLPSSIGASASAISPMELPPTTSLQVSSWEFLLLSVRARDTFGTTQGPAPTPEFLTS
jgi:hypothetical protein